jgi:hypothetical protein
MVRTVTGLVGCLDKLGDRVDDLEIRLLVRELRWPSRERSATPPTTK